MKSFKIIFILCAAFFISAGTAFSQRKMLAIYNGEKATSVNSRTIENKKYVSLNDIARLCDAQLSWFRLSGKLVMNLNGYRVGFHYGTSNITIDDQKIKLPFKSYLVSKEVFVALDFILGKRFKEISDINVTYNRNSKILLFETTPNVGQPRIYTGENSEKVIFEFTKNISYKTKRNGNQFEVTFYRGRIDRDRVNFEGNYIKKIKTSNLRSSAQCIITLAGNQTGVEERYDENKYALVLIAKPLALQEPPLPSETLIVSTAASIATNPVIEKLPGIPPRNEPDIQEKSPPLFIKRIVVDPGHGGEDPGARGQNGTKEKDINLEIGKKVYDLLEQDGYEVYLTRDTDVFLPLSYRTNFANEKKADLFVSIHCNASPQLKTYGWEIYFLSEKATDDEAARTAALENSAVIYETKSTTKDEQTRELLWSMAVNEFMNDASSLCGFITKEVVRRLDLPNRGIRQAGFFVLRGAQMPAVLVECAFLSNVKEEAKLNTVKFQNQISDAVYQGIKEYDYKKSTSLETEKKGT